LRHFPIVGKCDGRDNKFIQNQAAGDAVKAGITRRLIKRTMGRKGERGLTARLYFSVFSGFIFKTPSL